ncbi:MAG: hypothetical protein B6D56_00355 [Candidatus Omnitrophica bacterium 4484_70.1]|nr:MAG: hypothetical protein B6D56_00355 [Candidatus Omnitrophica bacterium 4484_70.1]
MRVLILAAGYGTRLYPLTLHTPKALLSLGKSCILDFLVEKIDNLKEKVKIDEVIMVSNHRFYEKFLEWNKRKNLVILDDGSTSPKKRRGAIGDIKFAIHKSDDWLILGSDNIFNWELDGFVHFSLEKRPYPVIGMYKVKDKEKAMQLGVIKKEGDLVKELIEKPEEFISDLVATCIYFFPKESLGFIDKYIEEKKDMDMIGNYIRWLAKKTKVFCYLFEGLWVDIGTKSSLKEAKRIFKDAH